MIYGCGEVNGPTVAAYELADEVRLFLWGASMGLMGASLGALAVAVIFYAYRDHIAVQLQRRRMLRSRVAFMLWVMADPEIDLGRRGFPAGHAVEPAPQHLLARPGVEDPFDGSVEGPLDSQHPCAVIGHFRSSRYSPTTSKSRSQRVR